MFSMITAEHCAGFMPRMTRIGGNFAHSVGSAKPMMLSTRSISAIGAIRPHSAVLPISATALA